MSLKFGPFGEDLQFLTKLPKTFKKDENSYWFVDSCLKSRLYFKGLSNVTFLKAGEEQKSLSSLEKNFKKLLKNKVNRRTTVYCVGGGSIGDSIGFLCSVYMRGLNFIMIPTTWLSAVDSSVGGKTALNGFGLKNVMGSFFPPEKIIFVEELIQTSSMEDAEGEIFKTLMLAHTKKWSREIVKNWHRQSIAFSDLEKFVTFKSQIVKKDPNDISGERAVLNFGHSLGHALELENKLTHGEAVKQGSLFSLRWSHKKGFLKAATVEKFESLLNTKISKLSDAKLRKTLAKDKKGSAEGKLKFVFLSDQGPILEEVSVESLIKEYKRQV